MDSVIAAVLETTYKFPHDRMAQIFVYNLSTSGGDLLKIQTQCMIADRQANINLSSVTYADTCDLG